MYDAMVVPHEGALVRSSKVKFPNNLGRMEVDSDSSADHAPTKICNTNRLEKKTVRGGIFSTR